MLNKTYIGGRNTIAGDFKLRKNNKGDTSMGTQTVKKS